MIRSIEARDADAWALMRARLWPTADAAELAVEAHAFAAGAQSILAAAFVALGDGAQPLGFLELALRPFSDGCASMPVPHVEGWYVERAARGRGVGRDLMRAAEAWAQERGFNELASDTEVHNVASLGAHEACGFEEIERLIKLRKALR